MSIKVRGAKNQLDINLSLQELLLTRSSIACACDMMARSLPSWSKGLYLWRAPDKIALDVSKPNETYERLSQLAGEDLARVVARYPSSRSIRGGSFELRGAIPKITVVLRADERRFFRTGDSWIPGNRVSFQIERSEVNGVPADRWALELLEEQVGDLNPLYAHAQAAEEFWTRNMDRTGGGLRAVGVNLERGLPGLYWANYFGERLVTMLGGEPLMALPSHLCRRAARGMLLVLEETPWTWNGPERAKVEKAVRARVGDRFFYRPERPQRSVFRVDEQSFALADRGNPA